MTINTCDACEDCGFLLSQKVNGDIEIQRCDSCMRYKNYNEATEAVFGLSKKTEVIK